MAETLNLSIRFSASGQAELVSASRQATNAVNQTGQAADRASRELTHMDRASNALGSQLGRLRGQILGIFSVAAAFQLTKSLFEAGVQVQKFQATMEFATGSAERAAQEFEFIKQTSKELGLELNSTASAYSKLAAASRGTTLEGSKTRDIFIAIAKATTVFGLSADEAQGALLAIQQMMAKGVVSAEEFRGQLGERLPIATQAAAKALNVTTAEFSKMLEEGKILAEDFLPKFARAVNESLGHSIEKASRGAEASLNRLSMAWSRFKQALANTGAPAVIDTMAKGMERVAYGVEKVTQAIEGLPRHIDLVNKRLELLRLRSGGITRYYYEDRIRALEEEIRRGENRLRLDEQPLNRVLDSQRQRPTPEILTGRSVLERRAEHIKEAKEEEAKLRVELERELFLHGENTKAAAIHYEVTEGKLKSLASEEKARLEALARQVDIVNKKPETFAPGALEFVKEQLDGFADQIKNVDQALLSATGEYAARLKQQRAELVEAGETLISQVGMHSEKEAEKLRVAFDVSGEALDEYKANLEEIYVSLKNQIATVEQSAEAQELYAASSTHAAEAQAMTVEQLRKEIPLLATERDRLKETAEALAEAQQKQKAFNQSFDEHIQQLEIETRAYGMSERAGAIYLAEQQAILQAQRDGIELSEEQLKRLREATAAAFDKKAKEAAKETREEWKRTAESIQESLTDALLRGFESGKDFAENFRDALVNMFKTFILRPIIEPIVGGLASIVLGLGGTALPGLALGGTGQGQGLTGAGGTPLSAGSLLTGGLSSLYFPNFGGALGSLGGSLGLGATGVSFLANASLNSLKSVGFITMVRNFIILFVIFLLHSYS